MGIMEKNRLLKSRAIMRRYGDTYRVTVHFAQQSFSILEVAREEEEAKDQVSFIIRMMNKALERFREAVERRTLERLKHYIVNYSLVDAYNEGTLKKFIRILGCRGRDETLTWRRRMVELASVEELNQKFMKNTKYSGRFLDTKLHMPCGFCAEPDFLIYRVIDAKEALAKETVCKHCGRGVKAIYHKDEPGNLEFEIVQTCGPDAPEWMTKKPRRLEEVEIEK